MKYGLVCQIRFGMQLVIIDTGISKTKPAISPVTAVLGAYETRYPAGLRLSFYKRNYSFTFLIEKRQ